MQVQYGQVMIQGKPELTIGEADGKLTVEVSIEGNCDKQPGIHSADDMRAYLLHPKRFLCVSQEPLFRLALMTCAEPSEAAVTAMDDGGYAVTFKAEATIEG